MRLLAKSDTLLPLDGMGLLKRNYDGMVDVITKPYGMILVVGPTGSGKTTTLHSALHHINTPDRKIWTAEDPVEITQYGLRQVQVQPKIGFDFAAAMRAFLRADPDVIMVGEMRDFETAKTGVEASLTGHLVFSTLHTNDAAGAVTRLVEMGVEPFLVASSVDCVLAQRLARRLCNDCKEEYTPQKQALIDAGYPQDDLPEKLMRPVGCKKCGGTGYRGRMGVHEIMLITEEISDLTVAEATTEEIKKVAIEQGMLTLKQDGLEKVRMGLTSLEEIARVIV